MIEIHYGDIVVTDFNPVLGAEISKIRPSIVISRDTINKHSRFFIVVPFTSNIKKSVMTHVMIHPSHMNGLQEASKAMPEQLRSVDKSRFVKKIGSLEALYLQELEKKVLFVLNQSKDF